MLFNDQIRRSAGKAVLGLATLGAGCAGLLAAPHPAAAADMLAQMQSLITCGTTTACVSGANTNSGAGIAGSSNKGAGVLGTSINNYGVLGSSNATGGAGVRGQAGGVNGSGVSGFSPHGWGVQGSSADGFGVFGSTGGSGIGVFGGSISGNGVRGRSNNAEGVLGLGSTGGDFTGSSYGLVGRAGSDGAYPLMILDNNNNALLWVRHSGAVVGSAAGVGPFGTGADFSGTAAGVIARAPVGGYPLYATDDYGNPLFSVDGSGNVSYSGMMHAFARVAGGAMTNAFSPKTTLPTVEDTGTAQLVAGTAVVPLDPTFAASIDGRTGYRVFVTAAGDTRGLFVAGRSAKGFTVRESQGGRSTVSFDYRIVATTFGHAGERMAMLRPSGAIPRSMKPVVPKSSSLQSFNGH